MDLKQAIKDRAAQLGFALVGVTSCEPLPHEQVFYDWLESGRQGEMSYLASSRSKDCRAHPARILPGCRSVLVLGVRYPTPPAIHSADNVGHSIHGKVAAYAWGADYHNILPARLDKLVEFIQEKVGHTIPNRGYTDTGPLLERELAQRAGLGWIGKNTCLINPRLGSYFLLAELLLGVELEPDLPFTADRCGTCNRCIQACPTGCILPDRTLDARRCISYLTIELKGLIPAELRPMMGNWVFGCDICQQVCPWNRFATSPADQAWEPLFIQPEPDLIDEAALSSDEFKRKYRHSPLSRPKRKGYLRNVAVALGNLNNGKALKPLMEMLISDREPLVRAHAAWGLGQLGSEIATATLEEMALCETDSQVLLEIRYALAKRG